MKQEYFESELGAASRPAEIVTVTQMLVQLTAQIQIRSLFPSLF